MYGDLILYYPCRAMNALKQRANSILTIDGIRDGNIS